MLRAIGEVFLRRHSAWISIYGVTAEQLTQLEERIFEVLESGPLGRRELHSHVEIFKELPMVGWGLDAKGLAYKGKIVMAHQAASQTRFVRLDQWLPGHFQPELSQEEALAQLARRYFSTYGPATFTDFRFWAGLGASQARPAFNRIREELTEVEIEGRKERHYVFGEPALAAGSALRLLPKFDPLMMGWNDRSLFVPNELKPMVFRKAGQVEATVVADGQVRATWRTVRKGDQLEFRIEPYCKFRKPWLSQIPREAERTAKSLGFEKIDVSFTG